MCTFGCGPPGRHARRLSLGAPAHESTSRPARRSVASSAPLWSGLTQTSAEAAPFGARVSRNPAHRGRVRPGLRRGAPGEEAGQLQGFRGGRWVGLASSRTGGGVPTPSLCAPRQLGSPVPRLRPQGEDPAQEAARSPISNTVRVERGAAEPSAWASSPRPWEHQLSATPRSRSSLRRESPRSVRLVPVPSSRCSVERQRLDGGCLGTTELNRELSLPGVRGISRLAADLPCSDRAGPGCLRGDVAVGDSDVLREHF